MKAGSILFAIAMLMSPTIRAAPLFYLTVKKEDAKSVILIMSLPQPRLVKSFWNKVLPS